MARYLVQGNYIGEGAKGLLKEGGASRRAAIETLIKPLGGTVEAFYYTFGDADVYTIWDLPDNASAAAIDLMVNASGALVIKTVVLVTPEELDAAVKQTPSFRPPGQ
jgi:uncharacterized protein with GYD domain